MDAELRAAEWDGTLPDGSFARDMEDLLLDEINGVPADWKTWTCSTCSDAELRRSGQGQDHACN